jgi:hypothetical protein
VLTSTTKEAPASTDYDGRQYVGIDMHCQRSVSVRMTREGEQLDWVRIDNDPVALGWSWPRRARIRKWCWRRRMAGIGRWMCCRPRVLGCMWCIPWG